MIRKYNKSDINQIELLARNIHKNYEFKLDLFSDCLVYELNDTIIGFIVYSILYDRAEIVDIVIDSLYRKNGYANLLMKRVIHICKSKSCLNISLEVNENNLPAISLYKKNGFIKSSVRKGYYGNSDAYLMILEMEE